MKLHHIIEAQQFDVPTLDKLVAFGALFYLIAPFDLIPDAIPLFGYVDDFIILGIAALYVRTRYPKLFAARAEPKKPGTGSP